MADELCSRCEKNLDTEGSPRWCRACRASYQREYQDLRKQMAAGKGFAAGAEQLRAAQIAKLNEMSSWATLEVSDVISWIREFPAPRPN